MRAFIHGEMAGACKSFGEGNLPGSISRVAGESGVPEEISSLANTFCSVQQLGHTADYDLAESFHRIDVLLMISDVEQRISAWQQVEGDSQANLFLVSLLVWERVRRR